MEKLKNSATKAIPFLKEAGKHSLKASTKIFSTVLFFAAINFLLICFGFFYFFKSAYSNTHLYLLIFMIVFGVVMVAIATLKIYNYIMIDAANVFFDKIDDFKKKLAEKVVAKFESGFNTSENKKTPLNKIINVADVVTDVYGTIPKAVVKIFSFIVGKIPLVDFSAQIKQHLVAGNKSKAINYFVAATNAFFKERIFAKNNTRILDILFIVTILIQSLAIYLLNGKLF